jgi:hypothetical protein
VRAIIRIASGTATSASAPIPAGDAITARRRIHMPNGYAPPASASTIARTATSTIVNLPLPVRLKSRGEPVGDATNAITASQSSGPASRKSNPARSISAISVPASPVHQTNSAASAQPAPTQMRLSEKTARSAADSSAITLATAPHSRAKLVWLSCSPSSLARVTCQTSQTSSGTTRMVSPSPAYSAAASTRTVRPSQPPEPASDVSNGVGVPA